MTRSAFFRALLLITLFMIYDHVEAQSGPFSRPSPSPLSGTSLHDLPDAPLPQRAAFAEVDWSGQAAPTGLRRDKNSAVAPALPPATQGIPGKPAACEPGASNMATGRMSCSPKVNPYARFLSSSSLAPLTPRQKLILAAKDVGDPFNLLTIGGEAAIAIGSNPHTHYGPGMPGFGRYAGVSLTQNMAGEFFSTFMIPSLAHQDPRYHRMPNLPVRRRIMHVIDAVVISQDDAGEPMFNYATVFGTIGNSALGNLYIPGRQTSWGASAARVSIALATDPIGNAVAEFLPDVARRVNINVVLVQRVINRVAIQEGAAPTQ